MHQTTSHFRKIVTAKLSSTGCSSQEDWVRANLVKQKILIFEKTQRSAYQKNTFDTSEQIKIKSKQTEKAKHYGWLRGEWPSGLYSLRQVTEVKLGRVRSDFGWVTSED